MAEEPPDDTKSETKQEEVKKLRKKLEEDTKKTLPDATTHGRTDV
jgi:hypothetical protein